MFNAIWHTPRSVRKTVRPAPASAAKARGLVRRGLALLLGMTLLSLGTAAEAQECPSPERHKIAARVPLIRNMINPNPLDDDFELPIPCGGKLVFRLVWVPAQGYFDDLALSLGCDNCGRETDGYMEAKRPARLSGTFNTDNLPEPWRMILGRMGEREKELGRLLAGRPTEPLFYFVSKYEITNFHWDAVMSDTCPGWDRLFNHDDPRPKTNLSWFEAVEFTARLTEWLLQNHPEALPAFADGRFGFVRLPTEVEWEYAARGGHRVPLERMHQEAYFPLKNRNLADYAVYTEPGAPKLPESVAWIGTKCGNPLGLFDTAGNASEMMLEPFRFSLENGLHGATGGFLIKGGSYRKSSREIMPGRREELPYFLDGGALRGNDIGFRVVLAGILTSRDRHEDLRAQYAEHLTQKALQQTLKAWTGADHGGEQTGGLEKQSISAAVWKALYTLESLIKYHESSHKARDELRTLQHLNQKFLPESELNLLTTRKNQLEQQLSMGETAVDEVLQTYLQTILVIRAFPEKARGEQLAAIGGERGGHPADRLSLASRLAVIARHADTITPHPSDTQVTQIVNDIVAMAEPGLP